MTWPRWLRRAVRNRHRHAIEQVSRRWRGGRRGDLGERAVNLISTQIHANSTPENPKCQAPTAPPPCRVRLAATSPTNTRSAKVLSNRAAEPCRRSKAPPSEYAVDRLNTKCVASTCAQPDVRSRQYWRPSMDSADAPTVSPVQRFTRMTAKKAKRPISSVNVAGVSDMSAAAWDFCCCAPILVQPSLTAACLGAGGSICGIKALAASAAAINAPRRKRARICIVIAEFGGAFATDALTEPAFDSRCFRAAPLSEGSRPVLRRRSPAARPPGVEATGPGHSAQVRLEGYLRPSRHASWCPGPRHGSLGSAQT
jgi:hypothetical protein